MKVSPDGHYITATGIYPPTIKLFETRELSMKCLRGVDSEVVNFCYLDEDYRKIAFACWDRNIEIHAQYGKHYKIRVPKTPRDLIFNQFTCDLLISASSNDIFRLSLDEGKFLQSFSTKIENVNKLQHNKSLDLLLAAGDKGVVEFWDYQNLKKTGLKVLNDGAEITSLTLDPSSSFLYYVGSADGRVRLYDLRYDG